MSAESVQQLGRVAGDLKSDLKEQQRIIPDIAFTCSGTVTEWIVAAKWKNMNDRVNFPEMQIWRETATGSGVYTKIHGTTLSFNEKNTTEIYHYTITPIDVRPGDILGMFEQDMRKLELYYTDTYGPVNYYTSTDSDVPPDSDFNIGGMETQYGLPLLTVTIGKLGRCPAKIYYTIQTNCGSTVKHLVCKIYIRFLHVLFFVNDICVPTIEACVAGYGRHYRLLVLYTSRVNLFLTKRFDHTTVVFFSGNAQYST